MRDAQLNFLFSPVTRIKGVGASVAQSLGRLLPSATALSGSPTPIIRDLLFHLPVGIVDRRFTCQLRTAPAEIVATFVVRVDEHLPPKQKRYGKQPYKVLCSNETGDITLVFFNAREEYLKKALPVGEQRVISGRTEHFDYRVQMTHPDIIAPVSQLVDVQKPEPVYPLTLGITSRRIAKLVNDALAKLPALPEWIPEETRKRHAWPDWKTALCQAHHPDTESDLAPTALARMRLAYDEMLANQLHLALLRQHMQAQAGTVITGTGEFTDALAAVLPFTLTKGQQHVLADIGDDLKSGKRMGRLLQGDVGSGKTIVALFAMLRAAEHGLQSALMAPTELIAKQHYEVITSLLSPIPHLPSPILLTGAVKGAARKQALEAIESGKASIVIGTHALFQEKVVFHNLALIVVDEQHRFGVNQRMALSAKGNEPHILHMTATPIPRSLTMTLYGDMDISMLTEKPAGRAPIVTRLIPASRYGEMMERMKAALDRGEKAYWICPLIEDEGLQMADDVAAAQSRYTEFKARFGDVVGLVHGRMKADERHASMQDFASGKTRLLVATTVVEVGVDVRDATIMIVEHAERFGLAQLHQLRGRVGRGEKPSSCVLLYSEGVREENNIFPNAQPPMPNASFARLSILRDTEDGFKIAEADLAQRGGGDLLGTRQSGMPRFVFMDLWAHTAMLVSARDEAKALISGHQTSDQTQPWHRLLQVFDYEH